MRRGVLLLLPIVVVCGGIVWWIASGPMARVDEASRDSRRANDGSGSPVPANAIASEDAKRTSESRPLEAPPLTMGLELEPSLEHGVPVVVVDEESGEPQPFALVTWFSGWTSTGGPDEFARVEEHELDWTLDHVGQRYRADEKGQLRVARSTDGVELVARAGDRIGATRLSLLDQTADEKSPPRRIEVEPRRTLRIQVVDGGGRPVPDVELRLFEGPNFAIVGEGRLTTKGPDAIAEFHGAQLLFDPDFLDADLVYGFSFVERHATKLRVKRSDLDGAPLRMQMPPVGSVELVVVDRRGAVVPAEGTVDVEVLDRPRTPGFGDDENSDGFGSQSAQLVHGVGVLRQVVAGMWLEVNTSLPEWGPVAVSAAGPKLAGDHVRLELPIVEDVRTLRARVVDEQGAPVGSKPFGLVFWQKFGVPSDHRVEELHASARTHADGTIQFWIQQGRHERPPRELMPEPGRAVPCVVVRDGPRAGSNGGERSARCDLSDEIAHHGGDLGTIVMRPAPLIASGVVVDDVGEPVAGASVAPTMRAGSSNDSEAESPLEAASPATVTRRDGTFELRGEVRAKPLELSLSHPRHVGTPPTPIQLGATGLRLVLPRAAAIAVHLLVDHDQPLDGVTVKAERVAANSDEGDLHECTEIPDPRGDVLLDGFAPGRANVTISVAGYGESPRPLLVVEDVELVGGAVTRDPRLAAVDLRGRFDRVRLLVVDEEGQPVDDGTVLLVRGVAAPDSSSTEETFEDTDERGFVDGKLDLVTTGARPEVEVTARGFRPQKVVLVAPTTRVVMLPSIAITLELDPPPKLADHVVLYAMLGEHEGEDESLSLHRLSGESPPPIRVAGPGAIQVRLLLSLADDENSGLTDVESVSATVAPSPVRQTIRVHVDPARLEAAQKKALNETK